MIKSDLLFEEEIEEQLKSLNTIKNTLICAGNGEIDKQSPLVMESLQILVHLEFRLDNLKNNLPFIQIDLDKMHND